MSEDRDARLDDLRAAIARFAAEEAPAIVEQARAEAHERATSLLADAMTRALLDSARDELGGAPAGVGAAPVASAEPAEAGGVAHYVYGVVRAGAISAGDAPEGVIEIEHDGLCAVARLVSLAEFSEEALRENLNDVEWLEHTARAHEDVLDSLLAKTTVVPLRLCTIYNGSDQVLEMLDRERAVFEGALTHLAGKTEWGVKLIAAEGALERALEPEQDAGNEDVAPGAAFFRDRGRETRARDEADHIAQQWADEVHDRASTHAVEALLNPVQNPEVSGHVGEMLLNGVYLVDDQTLDKFRGDVDAARADFEPRGASVELTGPWPPYNFVKGSIEAAR
jgi:hypothetical protein